MTEEEANSIIEEFNRDHHRSENCLFVTRLFDGGFSATQVAHVIQVMEVTCNKCFDDNRGRFVRCQCHDDE